VWWSHPQSEDAGEVEADVYVVDGDERGVLEANDRLDETDEAGDELRAVLRRRRPVVRRDEGVNGWKRDEVRVMMYCENWSRVIVLVDSKLRRRLDIWLMERRLFYVYKIFANTEVR
jgi:hypothetical protein